MKKLLILLLAILTLTGCTNEKTDGVKLDLDSIEDDLAGIAYSVNEDTKEIKFIFKDNITVTEEYMTSVYNVDFENVEDFLISIPSTDTRAEMYAIVLPKDGKKNIVEKEMQKFIKSYQKEWTGKTQETMVKNVLTQSYGNYLIYIISNKSETVFSTITGK